MAQAKLGVPVVVENRPGGGGSVGIGQVVRAPADGYTLVFLTASPVVIRPLVADAPYDPIKDLESLGRFMINHSPVAVRADSQFKTFEEMIEYARTNPGKLRWAAGAPMGSAHLTLEAMFRSEKVQTTFVPTNGGVEAMTHLLGGQLEMVAVTDYPRYLKEGKIRLLAESGPLKLEFAPEIKTFKEMGYPLALAVYSGWAAPKGVPTEVVEVWDKTFAEIVKSQKFADAVASFNGRNFYADSATFSKEIASEIDQLKKVLDELGLAKR